MRKLIALVVVVLVGLTATAHATLVVGVTTRDGWVACADKRIYDTVRGGVDEETKVQRYGDRAIVAYVGGKRLYQLRVESSGRATPLGDLFNAAEVIEALSRTRAFDESAAFWTALSDSLVRRLSIVFEKDPGLQKRSTENLRIIFHWNALDGGQRRRIVDVIFVGRADVISLLRDVEAYAEPVSQVKVAGALVDIIESGKDSRFEVLRSDAQLRRFLFEKPLKAVVGASEVELFARRLIRVSSQRVEEIGLANQAHISPTSDCLSVAATAQKTL